MSKNALITFENKAVSSFGVISFNKSTHLIIPSISAWTSVYLSFLRDPDPSWKYLALGTGGGQKALPLTTPPKLRPDVTSGVYANDFLDRPLAVGLLKNDAKFTKFGHLWSAKLLSTLVKEYYNELTNWTITRNSKNEDDRQKSMYHEFLPEFIVLVKTLFIHVEWTEPAG